MGASVSGLDGASAVLYHPGSGRVLVGDRQALRSYDPSSLEETASSSLGDPVPCRPFDPDATFGLGSGAAYDDSTLRCGGQVNQSVCLAVPDKGCAWVDGRCREPFFSSECGGNRYMVMLAVDDTTMLSCSSIGQCQRLRVSDLSDLSPPQAPYPRGWYCDYNRRFPYTPSEYSALETHTSDNCPVWRYNPKVAPAVPETAAAVIATDQSDPSKDQALYLMSSSELQRRDGTNVPFYTAVKTDTVTKRSLAGFGIKCRDASSATSGCSVGTYNRWSDSPGRYLAQGSNRYTLGFADATYVYFLFHEAGKGKLARFCSSTYAGRPQGYISFNAYVKVPVNCGDAANEISSAVHRTPGAVLASAGGLGAGGSYVFAVGRPGDGEGGASALCILTLQDSTRDDITPYNKQLNLNRALTEKRGGFGDGAECGSALDPVEETSTTATTGFKLVFSREAGGEEYSHLAVDVVNGHTVAYVGTASGKVLAVFLAKVPGPRDEDGLTVIGEAQTRTIWTATSSITGLSLAPERGLLFALTAGAMQAVELSRCSNFTTCGDCAAAKDPYCGWCALESKCTERAACASAFADDDREALYDGPHWLQDVSEGSGDACPALQASTPPDAHVGTTKSLTLTVKNLAPIVGDGRYFCHLGGLGVFEASVVSGTEVACSVQVTALGDTSAHEETVNVSLAYGTGSGTAVDLILDTGGSRAFTAYNCGPLDSCSSCASADRECGWCLHEFKCVHRAPGCRDEGHFLRTVGSDASCPSVSGFEPAVVATGGDGGDILTFAGAQLPPSASYECVASPASGLASGGKTAATYVSATKVTCPAPLQTVASEAVVGRSVSLTLEGNPMPASQAIAPLEYYSCTHIAGSSVADADCSQCLSAATVRFPCGWCKSSGLDVCGLAGNCAGDPSNFLKNLDGSSGSCPTPVITSFSPAAAITAGGTRVTILGQNLGRSKAEIEEVRVAGARCASFTYDVSTRTIVCTSPGVSGPRVGPVEVKVLKQEAAESAANFEIVTPVVTAVSPALTSAAGGLLVTVSGEHLDAGNAAEVSMAPMRCTGVTRAASSLTCTLSAASAVTQAVATDVCVQVDSLVGTAGCLGGTAPFSILPNPTTTAIAPASGPVAGGVVLVVSGTDLHAVQAATFRVLAAASRRRAAASVLAAGVCNVTSAVALACTLPSVPVNGSEPQATTLQFSLDSHATELAGPTYYPDPVLASVSPLVGSPGDLISLGGEWLESGGVPTVFIGGLEAEVVSVQDSSLTVRVPDLPSAAGAESGADLEVTLVLGNFQTTFAQPFRSEAPAAEFPLVPVAAGVGGAFALLILLFAAAFLSQRGRKRRQERHLVKQMQDLESQVVEVCKQGFAELQKNDALALSGHTLDPRPFDEFARRVFFTHPESHPVPCKAPTTGTSEILETFSALLHQEDFVLGMVAGLEMRPKEFTVADRCHVAALMMCSLPGEGDYTFTLLKELLSEVMAKGMAKKQPKLLLRRTETVAEKFLTCWLTTGLYDHVRLNGRDLYNLVEALHLQALKGPVDAVTGAAMYTLNGDSLLRARVDFRVLRLTVSMPGGETVDITVNSCATVTQAKRIALETGLRQTSTMASPAQNDGMVPRLELWDVVEDGWPSNGRHLSDVDESSEQTPGMVRINTLAHYGIASGARLLLVKVHGARLASKKPNKLRRFSKSKMPAMDAERWHLIKPAEFKEGQSKVPSEIYLTYLMTVKGTVQPFVDRMFDAMFDRKLVPPPVKALFDFLDMKAVELGVTDADVVHVWKNNSLALRFWINILKNPEFVFEFHKSNTVNSSLTTIGQVLMDSCSLSEQHLGKHSPANKHLYRSEVERYKEGVKQMYKAVSSMKPVRTEEVEGEFKREAGEAPICPPESARESLLQYAVEHRATIVAVLRKRGFLQMSEDFARLATHYDDAVLMQRRVLQRQESKAQRRASRDSGYMDVEQTLERRSSMRINEDMFMVEEEPAVMSGPKRTATKRAAERAKPKRSESVSSEYGFGNLLRNSFKRSSSKKKKESEFGFGPEFDEKEGPSSPGRRESTASAAGYLVPEAADGFEGADGYEQPLEGDGYEVPEGEGEGEGESYEEPHEYEDPDTNAAASLDERGGYLQPASESRF